MTHAGGIDTPKLAQSEALLLALDFGSNFSDAPDDEFDIIVGVPGQATTDTPAGCVKEDLSCFGVYRYKQGEAQIPRAPEYLSSDSLVTDAPNGDWKNWASVLFSFVLCVYVFWFEFNNNFSIFSFSFNLKMDHRLMLQTLKLF